MLSNKLFSCLKQQSFIFMLIDLQIGLSDLGQPWVLGSKLQVGFNCVSCASHPPWTSGYLGQVIYSLCLILGPKV